MIYRRNEKGRYSAVTDNGQIIAFDDGDEMIRFMAQRDLLNKLLGIDEEISFDIPGLEFDKTAVDESIKKISAAKKVRISVDCDRYRTDGTAIKKILA